MRAALHINNAPHQRAHGLLIKEGLERCGVQVEYAGFDEPRFCDFAVVWGFRQLRVIAAAPQTLVMEAGHVGDRAAQTSLGWDGLGGYGRYPWPRDGGERWRRNFPDQLRAWQWGGRYALVCGQVPGDAAVRDVSITGWSMETCREVARVWGQPVRYRPHPLTGALGYPAAELPEGVELSPGGELAEDLAGAIAAVTYSSTSGVEAALAGIPVIAMDRGSMAWDVASHDLKGILVRPERATWAHALAWTQWEDDEISSGFAWEYLEQGLNGLT